MCNDALGPPVRIFNHKESRLFAKYGKEEIWEEFESCHG
jgi:hypothetical protein